MQIKSTFLIILSLLLINCFSIVKAVDLSKTNVLVKSNDKNDPDSIKLAFAQILSNRSGQPISEILRSHVISESNILNGIKRSYMEKIPFEFQNQDSEYKYWFHVVMKDEFIEQKLSEGRFDLWPDSRPQTFIWLAEESEIDGINHTQNPSYEYWLKKWAQSQAIDIKIIKDNLDKINPSLIKKLSPRLIDMAKDRFNTNHVAPVFVQILEDQIKIRSGLSIDQSSYSINHFNDKPENLSSVFYQVVSSFSQKIADNQRIINSELSEHTVQILISNLTNYGSIIQLQKYLDSLSVISEYEILSAKSQTITLRANVKVNNDSLINLFETGRLQQDTFNTNINQLNFIWN